MSIDAESIMTNISGRFQRLNGLENLLFIDSCIGPCWRARQLMAWVWQPPNNVTDGPAEALAGAMFAAMPHVALSPLPKTTNYSVDSAQESAAWGTAPSNGKGPARVHRARPMT